MLINTALTLRRLTAALFCAAAASAAQIALAEQARNTLTAFENEQQLSEWVQQWQAKHRVEQRTRAAGALMLSAALAPAVNAPQAKPAAEAASDKESITNVQTAGVDEGGIVKRHGDHLVILRRGRLFTVAIGDNLLRPVAMADAFAPGVDPRGTWYDEMLIAGNTVVVIGYSYQRSGTEVGLFDISQRGDLKYRSTYHLRSNDYYSSRNYASRLMGNKLIFYTPHALQHGAGQAWEQYLPAYRRWQPAATPRDFKRILPATRIYRTDDELGHDATLHTVTTCDLSAAEMQCESTAVLGPSGRVHYVSAGSVYVWTTQWRGHRSADDAWGRERRDAMPDSAVFRLSLQSIDGAPSSLKTTGSPIDQMSFLEDDSGHLNVLLRARAGGGGMWNAEHGTGSMALLRVKLSNFGDARKVAHHRDYRALPEVPGYNLQNRYIGNWLLYGNANFNASTGNNKPISAVAVRYADRALAPSTLALPHGVERIESLGSDAVLIGSAGADLHFSSVRLAATAQPVSRFVQADATQGETRTHGFFYRAGGARGEGVIGLPIVGQRLQGMQRYTGGSAAVLFVRNQSLELLPMGRLQAHGTQTQDGCRASCVDWYGNARPLFLGERVFALMGYELVEGAVQGAQVSELHRVSFAPPAIAVSRSH